jgi:hypothetical protein
MCLRTYKINACKEQIFWIYLRCIEWIPCTWRGIYVKRKKNRHTLQSRQAGNISVTVGKDTLYVDLAQSNLRSGLERHTAFDTGTWVRQMLFLDLITEALHPRCIDDRTHGQSKISVIACVAYTSFAGKSLFRLKGTWLIHTWCSCIDCLQGWENSRRDECTP